MYWFGFFGVIGFVLGGEEDGKKEGVSTVHFGEEPQERGYMVAGLWRKGD